MMAVNRWQFWGNFCKGDETMTISRKFMANGLLGCLALLVANVALPVQAAHRVVYLASELRSHTAELVCEVDRTLDRTPFRPAMASMAARMCASASRLEQMAGCAINPIAFEREICELRRIARDMNCRLDDIDRFAAHASRHPGRSVCIDTLRIRRRLACIETAICGLENAVREHASLQSGRYNPGFPGYARPQPSRYPGIDDRNREGIQIDVVDGRSVVTFSTNGFAIRLAR
jgi:hypothetical protein